MEHHTHLVDHHNLPAVVDSHLAGEDGRLAGEDNHLVGEGSRPVEEGTHLVEEADDHSPVEAGHNLAVVADNHRVVDRIRQHHRVHRTDLEGEHHIDLVVEQSIPALAVVPRTSRPGCRRTSQ